MNIEKEVQILNINDILPNRFQPRITFDEKAIMELADSIKTHGVIQPIVVRRIADKYEIIAGERRYKASVIAGKTTIPAIVTDLDDKDSAEIALIENVQRKDLTPIEEAVSYKKILDMGYLNQSELATKLGKTQSTIANKLRLLNLTDEVQDALLKEKISERHARSLLKLDKSKQNEMLNRIITERMTVRKTDDEIAKITNNVEVLDFGKKEDMSMNNEINNFNIPSTPIVESNQANINSQMNIPNVNQNNVVQSIPNIEQNSMTQNIPNIESQVSAPNIAPFEINDTPNINPFGAGIQLPTDENNNLNNASNNEPINPGFMDINKIEAEATNINPTPINNSQQVNNQGTINPSMPNIDQTINIPGFTAPEINNVSFDNAVSPISIPNKLDEGEEGGNQQPTGGRFFANRAPEPQNDNIFESNNIFTQDMNLNQLQEQNNNQLYNNQPNGNMGFNPALASFNLGNQPVFNPGQSVPNEPIEPQNINKSVVEMGGTGFMREEPTLQPLMNAGEPIIKHDMKEAISLIRNCSKELEKLGFKLDVEEIDFENYYQATFKIDKE